MPHDLFCECTDCFKSLYEETAHSYARARWEYEAKRYAAAKGQQKRAARLSQLLRLARGLPY